MTTNMADEEQAPEETINAPDTDAPPTEAPPETEAPPTEAPPETEAPPTEAPPETEAPPTEAPPESETPPVETAAETTAEPTGAAATPTPEAEDAAKSAEEPAASPGGDEAAMEAGPEGQEGGDSAPAKEADESSGEANKHIFPNGTPPADDTVEGTRDEEQAPPVDQEPPQQTPSGEQDAPVDEGEAASVGNASPSGEVVTPGGDEMQQGDKEGGQGEDQGENLTPDDDGKLDKEEVIKVEPEPEEEGEIGELPPNLGVEDSKESVYPFKSDGASLRTTRSGSPPMPTTPDTFSLLSGPDPQVHPLTFGVDISEEPLRGLEEVEESLLPLEYDRDELLERYHKALHERHEMQEKNYQLQHKLADYFRKKKSDEVRQEANKNVSDQEQRYLKYMANLDELRRQEHEKRERYMLEIEDVKKRCESKQNRVEEERAKFVDFKKQIALNAVNSRSGKFIPPKDVESYLVTESRKEMEVANVRLENIKLKNKLKKKEQQLKSKEELAEGLHLIDFEQLKIENQTYNEKIEERNEELLKLRKKITSTVQVLTHLKEKLQFVQAENQIQKRKLQSVEELAAKKRDILSRTKQARDGLRIDNQKLRGQCGLLANKSLLRDYEERIDESDYLRQRIQDLTMKHAELTLNLNGIKRRIEQAKVSQVV